MSLVNYSSSSESRESEDTISGNEEVDDAVPPKRAKFSAVEHNKQPLPNPFIKFDTKEEIDEDNEYDNPAKHSGRIRSFKHERGNWATFVCINASHSTLWTDCTEMCRTALPQISDFHVIDGLHLSLSKTVVLQYHVIESFTKSLERELLNVSKFQISLNQLKVYCNEERTRTFIALQVNRVYYPKLCDLLLKVDNVMDEFRLPKFYEDPSFHISFLWCLGDKVELINEHLDKLNQELEELKTNANIFNMQISEVYCKSGNKDFTFILK